MELDLNIYIYKLYALLRVVKSFESVFSLVKGDLWKLKGRGKMRWTVCFPLTAGKRWRSQAMSMGR